jgi:carbon-monoxide dehydrogenase small subunit
MKVNFTVNDAAVSVDVEPRMTLVDCLRHELNLTGSHVGCEHGVCGACTIIVDGRPARGCLMLAVQADGARIETVEGLAQGEELSPLQRAFRKHHALQCGFCTPGMLMTAHALLKAEPNADRARIAEAMSGNLCRCTGYIGILDAIEEARSHYAASEKDRVK